MENLLIDPKTGQEYTDVPSAVAAKYLGVSTMFIREGLITQRLPFGSAVQVNGGKWSFNIPIARLKAYKEARDLDIQPLLALTSTLAELVKPA